MYERVGGARFFERLVDTFYDGVANDEVLLRLYPEAPDLTGARHRLTLFLIQYWGGPTTYSTSAGTHDCGCATCASTSDGRSAIAG